MTNILKAGVWIKCIANHIEKRQNVMFSIHRSLLGNNPKAMRFTSQPCASSQETTADIKIYLPLNRVTNPQPSDGGGEKKKRLFTQILVDI